MRRSRPSLAALGAACVLALPATAHLDAQHVEPPPPTAYALEDVTLVGADGARRAGVTLVVREGRIAALAPGAEVPADARVIEGDSLFVYPGLVDAEGEPRFSFPEADGDEDGDDGGDDVVAWNPERPVQGFLAHRRAVDALEAVGEDLQDARKAGVVASAVHPSGGVLPGRGALLLHRLAAEQPRELVLAPVLGPVMAFTPGTRVYPSTHFGLVAFLRQVMLDAERHASLVDAHAERPDEGPAPSWDPDLEVLAAAARGEAPVYFRADAAANVRQALELADGFGFRPVIVGGEEAWRAADELARRDVPVLVSLDFPEPTRWQPEESEEAGADTATAPSDTAAGGEAEATTDTAEAELDPAVLREKREIEDAWANAGRLVEAGVRVALTSGGGEADLREGARKAVEYGLSEEAALRALTATPAELLGVPWLARVEPGGSATFVVTDGPLLDEDTRVRYTFVEGRMQVGSEPGAEPDQPPAADLGGTWSIEIDSEAQSYEGTLELEQDGARFDGTLEGQFGTLDVDDGLVSGEEVSFSVTADIGGEAMEVTFSGTVSGDRMSGSGSGPPGIGAITWTAEREGPDGRRAER